jgi:hypothetical protein
LKNPARDKENPRRSAAHLLEVFDGTWSNASQLYWTEAKPGDELTLAVPVPAAGECKLTLEITGANDKAIQAYLVGLDFVRLQAVK